VGSNEDIPAFRWVEKEAGRLMTWPAVASPGNRRHPILGAASVHGILAG
jgi:hypothetical protein